MAFFLNNCANRDHRTLFGADAFYDLNTWGIQDRMFAHFRPGARCVVASQPKPGSIRLAQYTYTGSRTMTDDRNRQVHVLCGTFEKEETMSKADAAAHEHYLPFFDKNGNFKRQSVIRHGAGDF